MESQLYVDKYRPKESKYVVGADYVVRELTKWLKAWKSKGTPKGFLLSGPPGIGKSLVVDLVVTENGIPNAIKFDSTKKRTKKALQKVVEAFGTRKVDAYLSGKMQRSKVGVVIVDDIDTMLTAADQGGVRQIALFIKDTKVPVICICNDPTHKAMQALKDKCHHVRMQRPSPEAITIHLTSICKGEKLAIPIAKLRIMSMSSGGDVRQAVNELQFSSRGDGRMDVSVDPGGAGITMDRVVKPFDAIGMLLKQYDTQPRQLRGLLGLASRATESDPTLMPLIVHENYLRTGQQDFSRLADAAEAMSAFDVVEGLARRKCPIGSAGVNSVMPDIASVMGVAVPCYAVSAKLTTKAEFPVFFNRIKEINARTKTTAEVACRMSSTGVRCSAFDLAVTGLGLMQPILVQTMEKANPPAKPAEAAAVASAVSGKLASMRLTRQDWNFVAEMGDFPKIREYKGRKLISAVARTALAKAMAPVSHGSKAPPKKKSRPASMAATAEETESEAEGHDTDTEMQTPQQW